MNQFEKAYQEERKLAAKMENAKTPEEQRDTMNEYDAFMEEVEDLSTIDGIAFQEIYQNYAESRRNESNILVFQGITAHQDLLVQIMKANRIREFAITGDPEAIEDALQFIKAGCKITGAKKVITFKTIKGKETRKPALTFRIL